MTIRVFKRVRREGDWEINFIGKRWNLRIARSQIALWRDLRSLVNFYHPVGA